MSIQRKYRLNLRNYGNMPAIMVSQYDAGYNLVFEIYDGASPASNLSAYTVTLKGTRCDGLGFTFAGTVASNVLSFLIDNSMTAVSGRGSAEVVITDNNDLVFASFNLPVFVEKAVHPDSTVDADTVQQQTLLEQIQAAASSVTDMTVSSTTLAAGSEATVTKTTVDDVINLEFGLPQGATGATGATPNLTIGTVTTLDPDDDATATITGTAANPVLNLGIPKGDTGEVSQAEFDEIAGDVSQLKSELTDIRVGADGTTYNSAGAAVRGQITDLERGYKQLEISDMIQGSYNSAGAVTTNTARIRNAGFINVKAGEILSFVQGTNAAQLLFGTFSTDGTFVSDSSWYSEETNIKFDQDRKVICVFRNASNTDITPDQFDATLRVLNTSYQSDQSVENAIDAFEQNLTWGTSGYIKTDGSIQGYTNFYTTPFIPVDGDVELFGNFWYVTSAGYHIGFYDADYEFISGLLQGNGGKQAYNGKLTLPANTKYIRISNYTSQLSSVILRVYHNISSLATSVAELINDPVAKMKTDLISVNDIATYSYPNMPKILWISDVHWNNDCYAYLKYLADFGQYDALIISGDLNYYQFEQTLDATKTGMSELARLWNSYYKGKTIVLPIRGNHDGHVGYSDYTSEMFANAVIKPFHDCEDNGYYYYDLEKYHIRMIMLNSCDDAQSRKGFTSAEVSWFEQILAAVPNGWSVISVSHHPIIQSMTTETVAGNAASIVSAIQSFVTNRTDCKFIAHLSGHTHRDELETADGINYVSIIDSSTDQSDYSADVLCVNQSTNTVNLIRSGQGSDRTFTY